MKAARGFRRAIGLGVVSTVLGCAIFDWAVPFVNVGDAGDVAVSDSPMTDGGDGGATWTCESITSDPLIKQKLPAIVPIDLPPNTNAVKVDAGDDLQQKINAAKPGDVLQLAQGSEFKGPFTLPPFSGAGWIVIRTETPDDQLAMPGTRVSPALAPKMAKLSASSTAAVISPLNGAGGYRIIGLEIEATTGMTVDLGVGGSGVHDVILDRVYTHGGGMGLQGKNVALIDSYASGASASYAILLNGSAVRITNDAIDSSENHVWIENGSDVEICRNALTFSGTTSLASIHMTNASNVLVAGNVIATAGTILSLTQGTQTDLTVAYNHTTRTNEYMYLTDSMTRVVVHDNLFESTDFIDNETRLFGSGTSVVDVKIDHNTYSNAATNSLLYLSSPGGPYASNFVYTNNVTAIGQYGVHGSGATGTAALDTYLGSYTFTNNALWGDPSAKSNYPSNNFFPQSEQDVGFATDWSLTSSSLYKGAGSDGKDIGADIATLTAATMNVP